MYSAKTSRLSRCTYHVIFAL